MKKILIIDDDPTFRLMLKTFLSKKNYNITDVSSAKDCVKLLQSERYDLILTDFRLPDLDGLELLQKIKSISPGTPVIIMTGYGEIRMAVKSMKYGAFDYVTKPINPDEILLIINNALQKKIIEKEEKPVSNSSRPAPGTGSSPQKTNLKDREFVKGSSSSASQILKYIDLVSPTNMSVIVQGESGTGKEYVSRMIHQNSKRADAPFIAIDCGALSKDLAGSELFGHIKGSFTGALGDKTGQFEAANGGTLFLDEIGNLSYDIQVKLLRAIQERRIRKLGSNKDIEVDVRIIAATNEDLLLAVQNGDFREDLYHRINEFKIEVPPLRERKEDIEIFAQHFLDEANAELEKDITGFDQDVLDVLYTYSWPGNLREFKNVVKRAVLLCQEEIITMPCIPQEVTSEDRNDLLTVEKGNIPSDSVDLKAIQEKNERELIINTLKKTSYNKSKTARLLNIDRKTLYNKLKLYEISI
ncbi:sigma-54 dependent transcriptional regulator [Rapidithrix thailandica]|uniref:Sigma-54 dependent transcriptional regulator n=1 Tax=Rapidithrix thailandica TaxID=413964 RepID=A0AAW9S809_9BACT